MVWVISKPVQMEPKNIHSVLLRVCFLRCPRIFHPPFARLSQEPVFEIHRGRFLAMTKLALILIFQAGSLPAEVCHRWVLAQARLHPDWRFMFSRNILVPELGTWDPPLQSTFCYVIASVEQNCQYILPQLRDSSITCQKISVYSRLIDFLDLW